MELFDLIQTLCHIYGPAGGESEVRLALTELVRPYSDDIQTDVLGNLIIHKKGPGPKVMFSAHMDSIGLMVTHIDKEGFLRAGAVGGISPKEILYTPVRFKNGIRGVVVPEEKAELEKLTLNDCYVDIGAENADMAKSMVQVGDVAVFDTPSFLSADRVASPYLDDRAACAVIVAALERIKDNVNDLYFVFSAQEEVGARGAKTAAWTVEPDYGVAVDVTDPNDTPGSRKNGCTRLGAGAAVKIMDHSVISSPEVVARMEQIAEEKNIPVQRDIMIAGGTDGGAIHLTRSGVRTGGISIPCRHVHTPVEMVSMRDLNACVDLVANFAQSKLL